jgi:hypothetical protein
MSKEQIESILDANTYLIECKCASKCKKKYEYARRYLNLTVHKVLFKPKKQKPSGIFLSIFYFFISVIN